MMRSPYYCDKNGMKKGTWTPEEDKKLVDYVTRYGHWNWRLLPKFAGLDRCGKSCRLRWLNYLRPNLKRGNYTSEEEDKIVKLHRLLGNRWSAIAAEMPGRTDNEIKNHWHTKLNKQEFQHNQLGTKSKASKSKNHSPVLTETENNIVAGSFQNLNSSSSSTTQSTDSCSFSHQYSLSINEASSSTSTETESSAVTSINIANLQVPDQDQLGFIDEDIIVMSTMVENFWLEQPYLLNNISSIPNETNYDQCFKSVFDAEIPYIR